jgi:transcriptional regulator
MPLTNYTQSDELKESAMSVIDTLNENYPKVEVAITPTMSTIEIAAKKRESTEADAARLSALTENENYVNSIYYLMQNEGLTSSDVADMLGVTSDNIESCITQYATNDIKSVYEATGDLNSVTNDIEYLMDSGVSVATVSQLTGISEDEINEAVDTTDDEYNDTTITDDIIGYNKILGMPFRVHKVGDPKQRIFEQTIMSELPVISFIPGRPEAYIADSEELNITSSSDISDVASLFSSDTDSSLSSSSKADLLDFLYKSAAEASAEQEGTDKGGRFYHFKADYTNFRALLGISLSSLAIKMGVTSGFFNLDDYIGTDNFLSNAFKFVADKSSSSSESFSNDYGQSQVAGLASQVSDLVKEVNFLTGASDTTALLNNGGLVGGAAKVIGGVSEKLTDIVSGVTDILGGNTLVNGVSTTTNTIKTAINGANVYFPEIWKDSSFSRSYNVSFSFKSPYGNPKAIFEYVYVPFMTLMTMIMPQQMGEMGYSAPFIFKVDWPGCFMSDMAVCTSFSYQKGGNSNLWSKDGYPLEITCSMSIKDLYPVLCISKNSTGFKTNIGFNNYISNMAGFSVERYNPTEDWINSLKGKIALFTGKLTYAEDSIKTWAKRTITKTGANFGFGLNGSGQNIR